MNPRSTTAKAVGVATVVLLLQLVILPQPAQARWRPWEGSDENSDEKILAYAAGAALLAGGVLLYRKLARDRVPRRPEHSRERESTDDLERDEPPANPRLLLDLGWSYGISYGDSLVAAGWPVQGPGKTDRGLESSISNAWWMCCSF